MTAPATAPATAAVKSTVITNLDASPILRPSVGAVGGVLQRYIATITPTNSQATTDLSRIVRIPSNCIVQRVAVLADVTGTFVGNVGLWYSDDTRDGTGILNAGNLTAISSAFFANSLVMSTLFPSATSTFADPVQNSVVYPPGPVDITFASAAQAMTDGNYIPSQATFPIWQAVANSLALQTTPVGAFTNATQIAHFNTASAGASVFVRSDDPGGYFDICMQPTTQGGATGVKTTFFVDIVTPGA